MKKLLLLFSILSFFHLSAFSQSCLPEGITFTTQAQIDSFQVDYPGCRVIEGDVYIYGYNITDLSKLNVLDSIYGDLEFSETHLITDMAGLGNLKYIGGNFKLEDLWGFFSFAGLYHLSAISGSLDIEYCSELTSLSGLINLKTVKGDVVINENLGLTSLTGLEQLDSIGGSLQIGYWWGGNESLASLSGLNNLAYIGGGVIIAFNPSLISLNGLENLTSIGGDIEIYNNTSLTSISGLDNVNASTIRRISIFDNPVLYMCHVQSMCEYLADLHEIISIYHNAPGCDNPHEVADSCGFTLSCLPFGNYYFTKQANIDSFPSYYPDCHRLEGIVDINGGNITNLDSLIGIDTINGILHVCGNNNLLSLNGLNNLRYIQNDLNLGYWECGGNPKLTDLTGLNKLTIVGRWLLLLDNSGLHSLSGLDSLTGVGQEFGIYGSPLLKNLNGIPRLDSVQELRISGNDSMISLDGLQNLTHADYFTIQYNPMLITLDGIENVDADRLIGLNIHDNDSLTECNVQSVCDFLINYSGYVNISDNNSGCDSVQEVEAACGVGIEEVASHQSLVVIYPNPVSDQVTFNIKLEDPSKVALTVYNSLGQPVAIIVDEPLVKGNHLFTWNAENLLPGIYFYRMSMDGQALTGKLVIVR
jgi:hypothetical protein